MTLLPPPPAQKFPQPAPRPARAGDVPRPAALPCGHFSSASSDLAPLRCTRCGSLRCEKCCERKTIRLEPTLLCPCGGNCVATPKRATSTGDGAVEDLLASFADAVKPGTRARVALAAGLLGGVAILAGLGLFGIVGLVGSVIAHSYVVVWLLRVVRVSPESPGRATDWPDLVDPVTDLVWPFARAILAGTTAFGPAIASAALFGPQALLTRILVAFGFGVLPPVLLALGVRESLTALSPLLVARILRRGGARCAIASAFLAAGFVFCIADDALFGLIPFAGALLDALVEVGLAMVFALFLGRTAASLGGEE